MIHAKIIVKVNGKIESSHVFSTDMEMLCRCFDTIGTENILGIQFLDNNGTPRHEWGSYENLFRQAMNHLNNVVQTRNWFSRSVLGLLSKTTADIRTQAVEQLHRDAQIFLGENFNK